jgi:hypothetical protein
LLLIFFGAPGKLLQGRKNVRLQVDHVSYADAVVSGEFDLVTLPLGGDAVA